MFNDKFQFILLIFRQFNSFFRKLIFFCVIAAFVDICKFFKRFRRCVKRIIREFEKIEQRNCSIFVLINKRRKIVISKMKI